MATAPKPAKRKRNQHFVLTAEEVLDAASEYILATRRNCRYIRGERFTISSPAVGDLRITYSPEE